MAKHTWVSQLLKILDNNLIDNDYSENNIRDVSSGTLELYRKQEIFVKTECLPKWHVVINTWKNKSYTSK